MTTRRLTPDRLFLSASPRQIGEPAADVGATGLRAVPDPAHAANKRASDEFEEARKLGFAAGSADAERKISKELDALSIKLREQHDSALRELENEKRDLRSAAKSIEGALQSFAIASEDMSIEVAFAALTRLLGAKSADRSLMLDLCRAIVREHGHAPATLRVSEADYPLLSAADIDIPIGVDRRLLPGQCIVDTGRGQLETSLDVRLEALKAALLSTVAAHRDLA